MLTPIILSQKRFKRYDRMTAAATRSEPHVFLAAHRPTHQEQGLDPGHGLPEHGAHVVADPGKQNAKHRDTHQGVADAEELAEPGARGQVPKACKHRHQRSYIQLKEL